MSVSLIFAYHNEGVPFIMEAINGVKNTIDVDEYEIIVVDDFSRIPLELDEENVTVIRQKEHLGVGAAFDLGVSHAKHENIFISGSDMRFVDNGWASAMIKDIDEHPKSLTCNTCIGMNSESPEGMNFNLRRNRSRRNGATILIFWDKKSHPKMEETFRGIFQAQWLPQYRGESKESFQVPCALGAFYGIKKSWYEYIQGFNLHRSWGGLEPLISLRSWFCGGECRTAPSVEVGHLFKRHGTHGTSQIHIQYNKIIIARTLFDDYHYNRFVSFLGSNPEVNAGKKMIKDNWDAIEKVREEFKEKIVVDPAEWCRTWDIDFRQ